ncbi:hypothetical protein HDK90DRAFT_513695 [Phyllosticta capitalensis]|uniref:Uncharacterized protein n=1 Tax=Phyllosticta capitalensis TaxID=121624 RepID=A0ABR1YDU3_9PEZI
MASSSTLSSLFSTTLPIPPSCIEFVPGCREWCVVGTTTAATSPTPFAIFDLHFSPYSATSISQSSQPAPHLLGLASSTGSIALYAIDPSAATSSAQITHLRTLQLFPPTDLLTYFSWHPTVPLLAAAALADGRVVLCDCSGSSSSDEDKGDDADADATAATSTAASANASSGKGSGSKRRKRTLTLLAHALEAWVTAFAPDGGALYSGGDDAALKGVGLPVPAELIPGDGELSASAYLAALASTYTSQGGDEKEEDEEDDDDDDASSGEEEEHMFSPPWHWQDARTHGAGVTFILPLPLPLPQTASPSATPSLLLLTGSYDESLRLLAPPPPFGPRRVRALADVPLDGGVWRVCVVDGPTAVSTADKGVVKVQWTLLVSCMHAGTRVVWLTGSSASSSSSSSSAAAADTQAESEWNWAFEVLARFEEHQSMNYASAVQPPPSSKEREGEKGGSGEGKRKRKRTVISTSFYDRLVALWEWWS